MEITTTYFDHKKELNNLVKKASKDTLIKSLFATALLAGSIAATILLSGEFLAFGIGIILVSSVTIYQYSANYQFSKKLFTLQEIDTRNSKN